MKSLEKLRTLTTAIVLICAGLPSTAQAQGLWKILHRGDSLLTARYWRSNIDTAYITRPQTKWTVKARLNFSGVDMEVDGVDMGTPFKSKISAEYKSTVSVGINYLGLSIGLALNPAKLMGKYNDYELNLNSYGNRWGFDIIYQDARNFRGWYQEEGYPRIELPEEALSVKLLNVNAYYAFNHRRFSYPAAFSQSYIQRRSAGSFLLGISGQGQHTETKGEYTSTLKVTNIGIGAGYGFNWVPGRHWLIHLSALPTLTVYSNTSLRVNDTRIPLKYHFPEVIITTRLAVVRQFNNFFAGATGIFTYTNVGDEKQLEILNTKWRTRLFVGVRF